MSPAPSAPKISERNERGSDIYKSKRQTPNAERPTPKSEARMFIWHSFCSTFDVFS
jgi:hypothetical protein